MHVQVGGVVGEDPRMFGGVEANDRPLHVVLDAMCIRRHVLFMGVLCIPNWPINDVPPKCVKGTRDLERQWSISR